MKPDLKEDLEYIDQDPGEEKRRRELCLCDFCTFPFLPISAGGSRQDGGGGSGSGGSEIMAIMPTNASGSVVRGLLPFPPSFIPSNPSILLLMPVR